jgi:hypothetical protein
VVFREGHEHGKNVQALSCPDGFPLWVTDIEPGSVHDLTAAREHVLGAPVLGRLSPDLPTLGDGGHDDAVTGVHTPHNNPTTRFLHVDNRTYNAVLTDCWRAPLHHTTTSPSKIGDITNASLVLTHLEHGRLK